MRLPITKSAISAWWLVPALATALITHACADDTPKLSAEHVGDLSNPRAPRGSPDARVKAACGSKDFDGSFRRQPYLQRISLDRATVAFYGSPREVTLRSEGGTVVQSLPSSNIVGDKQLVELSDLEPHTVYCYELEGSSGRGGFVTAPSEGTTTARFAALGDSGTGDVFQRAVYDSMLERPFDFVVHLGDVAYEAGADDELDRSFFNVYTRTLRSAPFFTSIGNHDMATDLGRPLVDAMYRYQTTAPAARYYSFDWGSAHFVALDTERIDSVQLTWLEQDLANTSARFSIVFGHRPPFSSGKHGPDATVRSQIVPIVERHGVDLFLSGHEHHYERVRTRGETHYIVSGGGGRTSRPPTPNADTAFAEEVLHFVLVEMNADSLLLHAIDATGQEFDSLLIR